MWFSFDEILGVLHSVAVIYSKVYIIINIFNKYQISDNYRQKFLSGFFNLCTKYIINFFIISRPILNIEKKFKGNIILKIRINEENIRKYLKNYIFQFSGFII
jgi:hypothetical protein